MRYLFLVLKGWIGIIFAVKKYYLHRLHAFVSGAYILKLFTPVIKTERQKALALPGIIRLWWKSLAVKSNLAYYSKVVEVYPQHRLRNIGSRSLSDNLFMYVYGSNCPLSPTLISMRSVKISWRVLENEQNIFVYQKPLA